MADRCLAVMAHLVCDEVYASTGELIATQIGGAGAYAAVGAALIAPPQAVQLVSGVGRVDRSVVESWLIEHEISASSLFGAGDRSPITEVRYADDGTRRDVSRFGKRHFLAATPQLRHLPMSLSTLAGLYVFRDGDEAFWRSFEAVRGQMGGPVVWELHRGLCSQGGLAVVRELAELVDVISLNREEARALTGESGAVDALRVVSGRAVVLLRLGAEGSLVRVDGRHWRLGVAPGAVVDPTGGGNSYTGAFLACYARTGDPLASGRLAAAVAGLTISQLGPPGVNDEQRSAVRLLAEAVAVQG